MIKVSRKIKEDGIKVRRFVKEYESRYGKTPTISEIESVTDLKEDEIMLAMEAGEEIVSIQESDYEWVYDTEEPQEKVLDRMVLGQFMQMLSDLERKVIIMRYFEEITQTEIAMRLCISQVQVCRIEKRILKRWKECIIY